MEESCCSLRLSMAGRTARLNRLISRLNTCARLTGVDVHLCTPKTLPADGLSESEVIRNTTSVLHQFQERRLHTSASLAERPVGLDGWEPELQALPQGGTASTSIGVLTHESGTACGGGEAARRNAGCWMQEAGCWMQEAVGWWHAISPMSEPPREEARETGARAKCTALPALLFARPCAGPA